MREKVLFAWSGGKDSAQALHELKKNDTCEIVALLTTVTEDYDRISMHGVSRELLELQADSIGLPLEKVFFPKDSSNDAYEARMKAALERYKTEGVSSVAFGDIFLEELRKYREENLSKIGMKAIFPIWKRDSAGLARSFIGSGFKAVITCVDSQHLDGRFAGREFDESFLAELSANIDPCGENGEFHSFVYDGPIFRKRIEHSVGEVILRDNRFYFCDITSTEVKGTEAQMFETRT
jgi:uncharacterized protein (TIGR00290 family)